MLVDACVYLGGGYFFFQGDFPYFGRWVPFLCSQAGLEQIKVHGRNHVGLLLPLFEKYLENPGNGDRDFVVTSVIIFMGHVARHLEDSDPKVYKILEHIMEALKTPSEAVQSQIAECMAPLMRADSVRPHHHKLVEGFLRTMRNTGVLFLTTPCCLCRRTWTVL